MQSNVVALLNRALALIEDKSRWTTNVNARDKSGEKCGSCSSVACRWCAAGALWRESSSFHSDDYIEAKRLLNIEAIRLEGRHFTEVNDQDGHEAIVSLFKSAIAAATSSQKGAVGV